MKEARTILLFALCLIPLALMALSSAGPTLAIQWTNLVDATSQPASGRWNPDTHTLEFTADPGTGQFMTFCGPTVAVSWLTATGHVYECQATEDFRVWFGSSLRVVGTGNRVTLYDWPTRHMRDYRVLDTRE